MSSSAMVLEYSDDISGSTIRALSLPDGTCYHKAAVPRPRWHRTSVMAAGATPGRLLLGPVFMGLTDEEHTMLTQRPGSVPRTVNDRFERVRAHLEKAGSIEDVPPDVIASWTVNPGSVSLHPSGELKAGPAPVKVSPSTGELASMRLDYPAIRSGAVDVEGGRYLTRRIGRKSDVTVFREYRELGGHVLTYGQAGTGKGHPLDTPVLTPHGWIPIGKLAPGDEVIGSSGKPIEVYGVYDRGVLPTYRVTMSDSSWVDVDSSHLWRIRTRKGHWVTMSTQDIMDRWGTSFPAGTAPAIPTIGEYDPAPANLPIPPYMLGALIADGSLAETSTVWTKNDQSIANEMAQQIEGSGFSLVEGVPGSARRWRFRHPRDTGSSSIVNQALSALGLRGLKSSEKFIPDIYKTASLEQRRALLAGLMDGDGRTTVGEKGQAVYHTTSRQLAEDVRELMWSLGESASLGHGKYQDGTWRVGLLTDRNPFLASRYLSTFRSSRTVRERRIVDITRVEDQEIRCIAVTADDRLYVTKDYIVTHNTMLTQASYGDLMMTVLCTEDTVAADFQGEYVNIPGQGWTWVDGPLPICMEQGLLLYVDEIRRARQKQLGVLFSAMDGRREISITVGSGKPRVVRAAPGFAVAASANLSADSPDLDDALKSRFNLAIEVRTDYRMAREQLGIDEALVNAAENLDTRRLNREVGWAPQMRHLCMAQENAERIGMPAAMGSLVNSAPLRERDVVADVLSKAVGRKVERLVLA